MARISVIIVLFFIFGLTSCNNRYNAYDENKDIEKLEKKWNSYCFQDFQFVDLAPETQGSKIFHNLINDPSLFMRQNAIRVLETLYYSPADSIPEKDNIHFSLCTCNGIAEKSENTKTIAIKLSTLWIEKTLSESDRVLSLAELKSLLIQQLAHAFIYNPQGCGSYPENDEMKAYVEGLSDAVRLLNGDISYSRPEKTDSYYSGMSKTGFFYCWLVKNKDPEFVKKFNKTAVTIKPWSTEQAFKRIFGDDKKYTVDNLWKEYQKDLKFF